MSDFDLANFVNPQTVQRAVKLIPKSEQYIFNLVYKHRQNHTSPLLSLDEVQDLVGNVPLVKRGTAAYQLGGGSGKYDYIEPQGVDLSSFVSAVELNNLAVLKPVERDQWLANKIRKGLLATQKTVEAMACQSLSGSLAYAIKTDGGGMDTYTLNYGSPIPYAPSVLWDAAGIKLALVLNHLLEMVSEIQDKSGYGSTVTFLAGKNVFLWLFDLVSKATASNSKQGTVKAEISEHGISIAGFTVQLARGGYKNLLAEGNPMVPAVAVNDLTAVALDAPHTHFYLAIDDVEAGLRPTAFWAHAYKQPNPSGWTILTKSKPISVPVMAAICTATMTEDALGAA